jgi:phage terminase large subunit
MIKLYRMPEPGETFVIAGDPAEGGDNSCFVAISKKTAEVVMIGKSKEESSQLGHTLNHIGQWFNRQTGNFPLLAVERNTGSATLYVLKQLNYPVLYRMPHSFTATQMTEQDNYGWHTNTATRPKMLDDLALAIRQKIIKIPSKDVVDELFTFIRHARTGKPQADVGSHDDLVMALAIAWQVYQTHSGIALQENQQNYGDNFYNLNAGLANKWRGVNQ